MPQKKRTQIKLQKKIRMNELHRKKKALKLYKIVNKIEKNWILGFYAVDFKFNLSVGFICVIVLVVFER